MRNFPNIERTENITEVGRAGWGGAFKVRGETEFESSLQEQAGFKPQQGREGLCKQKDLCLQK